MVAVALALACAAAVPDPVRPAVATVAVAHDADDPALWIAPDPRQSLILGTDKDDEDGSLYVFGLDGKVRQRVTGLRRPNNVDVLQGVPLGGRVLDLAVVSERGRKRLKFYAIDRRDGGLSDVTGSTLVFASRSDNDAVPMGVAFHWSRQKGLGVVVSPKSGPKMGYLALCRLAMKHGKVDVVSESPFGVFSGDGEIEAVCVDRSSGTVFYSDEGASLRKTEGLSTGRPLTSTIPSEGYLGDREGLAVYATGRSSGFLLSSDQVDVGSWLNVYDRRAPHTRLGRILTSSDETDGIEATSTPLGSQFPQGIVVMMNSEGRNFHVYDWRDIARAASLTRP